MSNSPVLYETHMHTPLCKHASGQPEDYAAVAEKRGLKGIIVTCHNPTNDGWAARYRMDMSQFNEYVAMVERANQTWAGRIDIRLGLESDYYPGTETWLEELHQMAPFNYILGSVHTPLPDYKDRYYNGSAEAYQKLHFEHLAQAAETGLYDSLAHPDLIKIVEPSKWKLERLMDNICRALDRIAITGVAMEINTSGLNKPLAQMHPNRPILEEMVRRNIPVIIGADAHKPERVAANFEDALNLLQDVGYTHTNIFLNRKRHPIEINVARQSLQA